MSQENVASDKLPIDIDRCQWSPSTDSNGQPLAPGDRVSQPVFPRGTVRGILEVSNRSWAVLPDGSKVMNLVVVTDDGTRYNSTSKIRKLTGSKVNNTNAGR